MALNHNEREDRIMYEFSSAIHTKTLQLSHLGIKTLQLTGDDSVSRLSLIPESTSSKIIRLDLSYNYLTEIPDISGMIALRELWLRRNPLREFPSVASLPRIEVIDIRDTSIDHIPHYVSTLTNIMEISWDGAPVSDELASLGVKVGDLRGLLRMLGQEHDRVGLEDELHDIIVEFYLRKGEDDPSLEQIIADLIRRLRRLVVGFEDFKLLVRRASSLLPEHPNDMTETFLSVTMSKLRDFQRETTRKRLSADLEIRLRTFYFDRIEREVVERALKSIYEHVKLLEDVEFLIKYASQVLPATSEQAADGALVWASIVVLQDQLTQKRKTAVDTLISAISHLYPEQPPQQLRAKAEEVSMIYRVERFATKKELNQLAQLAAESGKIFPTDFASVNSAAILAKVRLPSNSSARLIHQ